MHDDLKSGQLKTNESTEEVKLLHTVIAIY